MGRTPSIFLFVMWVPFIVDGIEFRGIIYIYAIYYSLNYFLIIFLTNYVCVIQLNLG